MRDLRRLIGFLVPYRRQVALGFACLVLDVAFELSPGFVWLFIVDTVVIGRQPHLLLPAVGVLVLIHAGQAVSTSFRRRLLETVAQNFVFDMRQRLVRKLSVLPMGFYNESQSGDLISRVGSDVDAVQEVVINGTDQLVANFLRLLGVSIIFLSLNWILGLSTLLPIAAVGFILAKFSRRIKGTYAKSRSLLGRMTAKLTDVLGGIRVIKGYAREREQTLAFEETATEYLETNLVGVHVRTRFFPLVSFVSSFGNTLMIGVGAYLILQGRFTIGGLVAYRSYGRYFYGPIDNLTQINDMIHRALAASRRIFEVLDAPETIADAPDAKVLPPVQGYVEFRDVSFSYGGEVVLDGVSFVLEPGKRVALVGESGAGKSTIFSLAQRFWDPTAGSVLVDGHDVREVTQESLRRQVVSVQQDTFLFADTVLENIRFSRPDATDEEVEAAARAANALDFIERLPDGFDTLVGERGIKLSGGQRQRVSVARAFLADSRVLLLDEATSAVEPESERLIYQSLDRLMQGRATLIATHRLSTIEHADRILVLEKGRIVEDGTHIELLARKGTYARMVGAVEDACEV